MRHEALIGLMLAAARANLPPVDLRSNNGWLPPGAVGRTAGSSKKRRAKLFARAMGRRMVRGR